MSIDFILPDIGEGIVECELVEWLVNEGDIIEEDQPVADVMTDKALVQIPAMHSGKVEKLYYKQGDIAKVHAPLFAMTVAGQAADAPVDTVSDVVSETNTVVTTNEAQDNVVEDFILPDIGEGIVECELVEWLVKEGDTIAEDQPVADVMTDKALVQIPAMHAGTVTKLYYAKGDIAKVHAPLFAIERAITANESSLSTVVQTASASTETKTTPVTPAAPSNSTGVVNAKALASPAVRRVARELDVNIHQVPGTGKKGRIYKEDVVNFSQGKQVSHNANAQTSASANTITVTSNEAANTRVKR